MAIDANSAFLETTLAHEFNHAAQASDDWWESALFFEMSATFVESLFDDGTHFARGGTWPAAVAHTNVDANGSDIQFDVELMTYGAAYLRVVNTGAEQRRFAVNLHSDEADVAWRLLLATGGDVVSTLTVPPQSSRVVIALALPADTATSHTLSYATRTARLLLSAL